jgi:hypothetical protein
MSATPDETPFTIPPTNETVATEMSLLVQLPPRVVLENVVFQLGQTLKAPEIAAGNVFTVMPWVA